MAEASGSVGRAAPWKAGKPWAQKRLADYCGWNHGPGHYERLAQSRERAREEGARNTARMDREGVRHTIRTDREGGPPSDLGWHGAGRAGVLDQGGPLVV